jgi:hypothetical protein
MVERGAHLFIGPLAWILKRGWDGFWGVRSRSGPVDRAMARTHLALATSAQAPSKNKKRRSRASKRNAPASVVRGNEAEWSELEQAFFNAAPPDEPEAAAEPEHFDDLVAPEQQERIAALGQVAANVWAAFRRLLLGPARLAPVRRSRTVSSR